MASRAFTASARAAIAVVVDPDADKDATPTPLLAAQVQSNLGPLGIEALSFHVEQTDVLDEVGGPIVTSKIVGDGVKAHARVEDRIRHAKDTGLGRFPSREFKINQAWLVATVIAADLIAWTRLLALIGDAKTLAKCEPKALGDHANTATVRIRMIVERSM